MRPGDTDEVQAFLDAVGSSSAARLARVGEAALAAGAKSRAQARKASRLSAVDSAVLEKAVREAIEPLHEELVALGPGILRSAISDTLSAARAIARRDVLSDEEYAVLAGPFATAGYDVPPRRSDERPAGRRPTLAP